MKNLFRNNRSMILLLVAIGMISSLFPTLESHAQNITPQGLNRVGPIDPATGYPLWYEDQKGMKLQLCVDLDNCFIEPPDPLMPLHMPTSPTDPAANFPDEIFFFAAESIFAASDQNTNKGDRAVLVMALEGIFFGDAGVKINDQAVMSRIRIRIDNLQSGMKYDVIYPYGIDTFLVEGDAGPGAAKGPGVSMTRDIGLVEPLFFAGPLKGDIGPFLTTIDTPGATISGYLAPDDPFIGDGGLNEMWVTGSPQNTNVFRIEGPGVGLTYGDNTCADLTPIGPTSTVGLLDIADCAESKLFSVMGQVATKFGANIDRATYTKANGKTFVNIWANTVEGESLVASINDGPVERMIEGVGGNYFGRFDVTTRNIIPTIVKITNTRDMPASSETSKIVEELTITEASYTVNEGMKVSVQSSNFVDSTTIITATLTAGQATPVVFDLVYGENGQYSGTSSLPIIQATGTTGEINPNNQPPILVTVTTPSGGSAATNVTVVGNRATLAYNDILAIPGVDQSVISDGKTIILNGSASLGPITSYKWSHDGPTTGPKSIVLINMDNVPDTNSAQLSFVTPLDLSNQIAALSGKLSVNFTLMVSDGVKTNSATMTVNMVQPLTLEKDTCRFISEPDPTVIHPAFPPRYRVNREKWIVAGRCDLPDNQVISVYLGDETTPNTARLIGKTRVGVDGSWEVAPGNRTAISGESMPDFDATLDPITPDIGTSRVYLISGRGATASSTFTIN